MKPVAKLKKVPTLAEFLGCLSCIYQKQLMTMLPFLYSTRGDQNDYSDRPYILFRFSDVYLISAEAAFKGGATMRDAANMINVTRTRAALKANQAPAQYAASVTAKQIAAADVTLDFILEERSLELFAADTRWWDLSRTNKLVERVQLYNTEVRQGFNHTICWDLSRNHKLTL